MGLRDKGKGVLERLRWKYFLSRHFLPWEIKRGAWSLREDDFGAIFSRINRTKGTQTFVELGSGISSIIFGLFLKRLNKNNKVISFEGDREWAEKVQGLIVKYSLEMTVSVYHVPYKAYADNSWFDKDKISEIIEGRRIDALLVDAPPGYLSPLSRKGAIPFFLPCLQEEALVFLHDASRNDEKEIGEGWAPYFKKCEKIDTVKGMVFLKGKQ